MNHMLDTLRYAGALKEAGVEPRQAEAMAQALGSELTEQVASKGDIQRLEKDLKAEMKLLEQRITIRLGGLIVAGVAVLAALIKIP